MGCDIHIMVECKFDGKWVNCDHFMYNYFHEDDEDDPEWDVISIYNGRDYELFSFLAGVRNYGDNPSFGFDRGFPENAHRITKTEYDAWELDAHTPGYCTLAELKKKASECTNVTRKGYVTPEAAAAYRKDGTQPDCWCQWTSMNWEYLEWEDEARCFDGLIKAMDERKRDVFYLPENIDKGQKDDSFRIVFWFDN